MGAGPVAYAFNSIIGFAGLEGALAAFAGGRGARDGTPGRANERPRLALGPADLGGVRGPTDRGGIRKDRAGD